MENEEQLASLTRFQSTLYENFVTGLLDKEEYKSLKNSYHADINRLKEAASKRLKAAPQSPDIPSDNGM